MFINFIAILVLLLKKFTDGDEEGSIFLKEKEYIVKV